MAQRSSSPQRFSDLRRIFFWHKNWIAASCAALCLMLTISLLTSSASQHTNIWVASRQIPSGTILTEADLKQVSYPDELVPQQLADLESLLGKPVTAAIAAGSPITQLNVVGSALAEASPGKALTPFRLPDSGLASLVTSGSVIDIIFSQDGQTQTVAKQARVISIPKTDNSSQLLGQNSGRGTLVILEVTESEAIDLAAIAGESRIGITLRN